MSTPHINAENGDFAKVVLMPGDPLRAKWIADTFLHDVKQVCNIRGILGFTGLTSNNIKISVMASGMGQPSIGIYSYELFSKYGVESIIRVGTCGSYQNNINLGDVLLCSAASSDSNWASQYKINGTYSANADFTLLLNAYKSAEEKKVTYHVGNILSADVFYDDNPDQWKDWAKLGVMGVEMESYALYCNAARLNKKALCILTVSDHLIKNENMSAEQRVFGLKNMIEVAISTAEKMSK